MLQQTNGAEDTFPTTVGVSGVQIDVFQTGRVFHNGRVARKVSINEFNLMASSIRHNAAKQQRGHIHGQHSYW